MKILKLQLQQMPSMAREADHGVFYGRGLAPTQVELSEVPRVLKFVLIKPFGTGISGSQYG